MRTNAQKPERTHECASDATLRIKSAKYFENCKNLENLPLWLRPPPRLPPLSAVAAAATASYHFNVALDGLVGTQRKKAEHVMFEHVMFEHAMFENHVDGRTNTTKRLHNARAKTCGEDHATPF